MHLEFGADTAREQQRAFRMYQWKMVLRLADTNHVTFVDALVHRDRAAARCRIAQHGDEIAMPLLGIVAQRILANHAVAGMSVDKRILSRTATN